MEPTDQELLAATAVGDGEAFAMFWRRHTSTVMAFGIHHCATSEDVADLVADTFLAAFRGAGRYRAQTATAAPWLLGIATRLASNQHRTLARWLRGSRRAVGDRKVLELVAYAQRRPSEAALALGITPNAARLRLARISAPDTPQFQGELDRWLAASTRQSPGPAGRRRRRRVALLALAGLVGVGLVAVPVLGPRPRDTAVARSFRLSNGTVVGIDEFMDAWNFPRLRQQFADAEATLIIDEVPVNDRAIGRVFSVQMGSDQPPAANADRSGVRVRAGERVVVTVGRRARPDERVTTQGLTLFEVFPKLQHAIVRDDAVATGKALRALGFKVRWELIELNPDAGPDDPVTNQTRIVEPEPGMVVLSVLGPNGAWDNVDPFTDTLMVVMTSRQAREQLGH